MGVCRYQVMPYALKSALEGQSKRIFGATYNLSVTSATPGEGDATRTISFPCAVTMKEGFAVACARVVEFLVFFFFFLYCLKSGHTFRT